MELPVHYNSLTPVQHRAVREEYVKLQGGNCMYCHEDLTGEPCRRVAGKRINWKLFHPNFLKYPIHLQHCHKTGLTEGSVHAYCHAVMWQYDGR